MKENKYDNPEFFAQYSQMLRSVNGLDGAGEWHELKKLLPDFTGKRVLDLGCGFGWHCAYAVQQGAASALGIDLSEKMLQTARERNPGEGITYQRGSIEEADFPNSSFDVVLSSLALHYVEDFRSLCQKVYCWLAPGGDFVFSAEHPVFTAQGQQDWIYGEDGRPLCWPVDRYFIEGQRNACFLGQEVVKYHKTLTTYLNSLLNAGFQITGVVEPEPDPAMRDLPGMEDELRRPMMLLVSAQKEKKTP